MNHIDKDTKLFGSFSKNPGNRGSQFFNEQFSVHKINAVYKAFYASDIASSLNAAKVLKFAGCAIAMPFKVEAYDFVDTLDESAVLCGSVNTIVIADEDSTKGYNTDFFATCTVIEKYNVASYCSVYVVGIGGLGKAVVAALKTRNISIREVTRANMDILNSIENAFVFNCTPIDISVPEKNYLFDCRVMSDDGEFFRVEQAKKQFSIYTGISID
jgi:shikimate dehydrogenase